MSTGTNRTRRIVMAGFLAGLAVACGFALAAIPNIELITSVIFVAGYLLGPRLGIATGLIAMFIHSWLNPLGPAPLPIFVAQLVSVALIAACGNIYFKVEAAGWGKIYVLAGFGFACTLIYDAVTLVGELAMMAFTMPYLVGRFLSGLPFFVVHIFSNTAVFALLLPLIFEHFSNVTQSKTLFRSRGGEPGKPVNPSQNSMEARS